MLFNIIIILNKKKYKHTQKILIGNVVNLGRTNEGCTGMLQNYKIQIFENKKKKKL